MIGGSARSDRRKADPYRSAMSMPTFSINRGGANLEGKRREIPEDAEGELRRLFGKEPAKKAAR